MVLRSFQLYRVIGDLSKFKKENLDEITKNLMNIHFENEDPNRYGFEFVKKQNDWIYGCFAQEYEQEIVDYDTENKPIKEDASPFEYYVFIIILNNNEGTIALEQKRITRQLGLMAKTRDNFENTISEILKKYVPSFWKLEPYNYIISREEIIDLFNKNKIIEIKVNDLRNKRVPDDLKFFNPDFDKDKLEKIWWDDDFKFIEDEELKGENLQKTKAAKAAVYTGKTTSLTMEEHGVVKTIQSEIGPIAKLPIDNYDDKQNLDVERTVEFLKTKIWKMTQDEYQRKLEEFTSDDY